LVVIFLGNELVEARFGVEENSFERKLGAIVRMEVDIGDEGRGEGSEGGGECGGCGVKTRVLQEFAAGGRKEVTRIGRVLFSGQGKSPRGAVVAKLTSALVRVKLA
jgi:hypothetical protein